MKGIEEGTGLMLKEAGNSVSVITDAYTVLNKELTMALYALLPAGCVLADEEALKRASRDETEDLIFLPEVVVRPETVEHVQAVMRFAYTHRIAVTARGAGTGLSGSALPVHGGIVLTTERLNRILDIDLANHQATVEPGVVVESLQNACAEHGLLYPVDPASKGSCTIGGNVAQSSGGPRAVKYGTTRENVINLQVVLANGEMIWTGANVLKYATGYNLTQLMIGSEGTLGVVTKVVVKLRPLPLHTLVLLVPFFEARQACDAVSTLFMAGLNPSCLEFMERDAIDAAIDYTGSKMKIEEGIKAHLLIELDGQEPATLEQEATLFYEVLEAKGYTIGQILLGQTDAQKAELWHLRRQVAYAVKHTSIFKEEDTVVPRAALPDLLVGVKAIGSRYGFRSICYGHAGDGNLHVNILKGDLDEQAWKERIGVGIRELFQLVVSLGGTISGEHGIGLVQRPYLDIALSQTHIGLLKGIKTAFDPTGILNPGKIF
jgi:glycolate oxidase